jgi:hypothetical protein
MKRKNRFLAVLGMTSLVLCLCAPMARAQSYSIETGGSLYASTVPHLAGHFSVMASLDDGKTFSVTSIEMRGNADGQPVYTTTTGLARLLASGGRMSLWTLIQGGAATSSSATSGAANGGGAIAFTITKQIQFVVSGQALTAPTAGGWQPLVTAGFRFSPGD